MSCIMGELMGISVMVRRQAKRSTSRTSADASAFSSSSPILPVFCGIASVRSRKARPMESGSSARMTTIMPGSAYRRRGSSVRSIDGCDRTMPYAPEEGCLSAASRKPSSSTTVTGYVPYTKRKSTLVSVSPFPWSGMRRTSIMTCRD